MWDVKIRATLEWFKKNFFLVCWILTWHTEDKNEIAMQKVLGEEWPRLREKQIQNSWNRKKLGLTWEISEGQYEWNIVNEGVATNGIGGVHKS